MLNLPLYGALGGAFARGRPTVELAQGIMRTMAVHARAHWMPTFVDNPDVRADGRWQGSVDTSRRVDAGVAHTVTAWVESAAEAVTQEFRLDPPWKLAAEIGGPAGDDLGPGGRYHFPTATEWGANRQMDLHGVRVHTAGGALRLELAMHRVTQFWNPPNGFDHVACIVFIELPGRDGGATVMPLQQATLPEGMRWHLRLRAGGWTGALFSAEGASDRNEGRSVAHGAAIEADAARHTVAFTLPAAALGRLASLSRARIFITPRDCDCGYLALDRQAQSHAMGGGAPSAPKVMDASPAIVLP